MSEENNVVNVDLINLTTAPGTHVNIPWVSGFSVCGDEENLFIFSGNLFHDYKSEKNNLYEFLPPRKSRNILPAKSSELLRINLSGKTISSVSAPKEVGGNCTSMKLLDDVGQVIVIVSDPAIWLGCTHPLSHMYQRNVTWLRSMANVGLTFTEVQKLIRVWCQNVQPSSTLYVTTP